MNILRIEKNQEILQNLKAILNRRELSQRDFAELIGKKESEISRWFSGKFCISNANILKIEGIIEDCKSAFFLL